MPAPLIGRRVQLRPVEPNDYAFIRSLETAPNALQNYRLRAVAGPPDQYVASLWSGVLAQFVVVTTGAGAESSPIGLVVAYGADFRNGHCALAVVVRQEFWEAGWHLESAELLIDYLFVNFPFRKLYAEVLEPNLRRFAVLAGGLFAVEGRLRSHEFIDGRWVDQVTLALYRETWDLRVKPSTQAQSNEPVSVDHLAGQICDRLSIDRSELTELDSMAVYEAVSLLDDLFPGQSPDDSDIAKATTISELIALWVDTNTR